MSPDKIIILACGPSADAIAPELIEQSGAFIIAVNHAVQRVNANAFFTCDPSEKVRKLLANQIPGCEYFAAVPDDYGSPLAKAQAHRQPREPNVRYLRRLTGNGPWSHRWGLSEQKGAIHTGNSAYGALGLAFHMRPRKIAFLGLDGAGGYAFGLPGHPGDLSHLDFIFSTALTQLKRRRIYVMNGSPESQISCFRKSTPEEALEWIS